MNVSAMNSVGGHEMNARVVHVNDQVPGQLAGAKRVETTAEVRAEYAPLLDAVRLMVARTAAHDGAYLEWPLEWDGVVAALAAHEMREGIA